jgi:hypothetical protein
MSGTIVRTYAELEELTNTIMGYIRGNNRDELSRFRSGTPERQQLEDIRARTVSGARGGLTLNTPNLAKLNNLLDAIDRYLDQNEFFDNSPEKTDISRFSTLSIINFLEQFKPVAITAMNRLDANDNKQQNMLSLESCKTLLYALKQKQKDFIVLQRVLREKPWTLPEDYITSPRELEHELSMWSDTANHLIARLEKSIRELNALSRAPPPSLMSPVDSPASPSTPDFSPSSPEGPPPRRGGKFRKSKRSKKSKQNKKSKKTKRSKKSRRAKK